MAASSAPRAARGAPQAEWVHELTVHQVELELQNEELRESRKALEEARDRYLELYDFAPVGYLTLDAAARISEINLTGAALLGVDRRELTARPFIRFVQREDQPRLRRHLERVRASTAPQSCELVLRPGRGSPIPIQLTSVPTGPQGGSDEGVRCTILDIGERRSSEEERERRVTELLELNRRLEQTHLQLVQADKLAAIGQLAAGVAHEIGTPLSHLMTNLFLVEGFVGKILEGVPARPAGLDPARPWREAAAPQADTVRRDLHRCLAESREGLLRITEVVKDLEAFAHPETGRWERSDLHEIIEAALRVVTASMGVRARLLRDFEDGAIPLRCRPLQLSQVFVNILLHAARSMEPSGTITIRTGMTGSEAWFEIEDHGPGIAAGDLARIFDPFSSGSGARPGAGLGLSVAHGIVRSHGGRIEVRTRLGVGATFRVVLPADGEDAPTGLPPASHPASHGP